VAVACTPGSPWKHAAHSLPCGLGHLRTAKACHGKGATHGEADTHVKELGARQRGVARQREGAWQRRGARQRLIVHGKDRGARQRLCRAELAMRTATNSLPSDCLLCDNARQSLCRAFRALCRAICRTAKSCFPVVYVSKIGSVGKINVFRNTRLLSTLQKQEK
jgi:hypothetical protein